MKNLLKYIYFWNEKIDNNQDQTGLDINLSRKMVHYRRDLDSLGEYLKVKN
tara:strand:- start:168 stop:320 length:153 start_codon:yes stop_codon:yes gene_type:complete